MPKSTLPSHQLKSVPPSRIDTTDDTYRITSRTDVDDLMASIRLIGVLNPPLVIEKPAGYTIVSGFRRIGACQKLGLQEVTVRVLAPNLGSLEYLRLAIADNALQRPLDLMETSRSLHKLSVHLGSGQRLAESASATGLPTNPSVIRKMTALHQLPEMIQDAVAADTISLSMAMELKTMTPECATAYTQLFCDLKLSLNKQREVMTLVKEIARRESVTEHEVLGDRRLQQIIRHPDHDRGQMSRQLRAYLRKRRFPQIVEAETRFKTQRKQLNLGSDITLMPPRDFEGTAFALNLSFSSIAQLQAILTKLKRIVNHPSLRNIVERRDDSSQ